MPEKENEIIEQEADEEEFGEGIQSILAQKADEELKEDESEDEEDEEELGDGINFFAPPNRNRNLTTKQKLKANKEKSFTKKKKFKNKFNLPKCINTYGGCQNKPREGSNFCCEICEQLYEGVREVQRPNNYYLKFFEKEKTRKNEQVKELVNLEPAQPVNTPNLETK